MNSLTSGAVPRLARSDQSIAVDSTFTPIIQILKIIPLSGTGQQRFRCILSDGSYSIQGILASQNNDLVINQAITDLSLIRIKDCMCNIVQNKRLLIILSLDIIQRDFANKIGSPVEYEGQDNNGSMPMIPAPVVHNANPANNNSAPHVISPYPTPNGFKTSFFWYEKKEYKIDRKVPQSYDELSSLNLTWSNFCDKVDAAMIPLGKARNKVAWFHALFIVVSAVLVIIQILVYTKALTWLRATLCGTNYFYYYPYYYCITYRSEYNNIPIFFFIFFVLAIIHVWVLARVFLKSRDKAFQDIHKVCHEYSDSSYTFSFEDNSHFSGICSIIGFHTVTALVEKISIVVNKTSSYRPNDFPCNTPESAGSGIQPSSELYNI